jgi:hypothetical protein
VIKETATRLVGNGPIAELRLLRRTALKLVRVRWAEHRIRRGLPPLAEASIVTIVPTIGRASLVMAVESALAQGVQNHRIVVVVDGPYPLPQLPSDPRISMVVLPSKLGSGGAARNMGLSVIRSRYAAFLDDDNTWESDHLSASIDALNSTGADISYAACNRYTPDGERFDILGRPWDHRALRHENWVDTNGIVIRRDHRYRWSSIPYPHRGALGFGEDWAFVYRYGFTRKVVYLDRPTVNFAMSQSLVDLVTAQRQTLLRSLESERIARPLPVPGTMPSHAVAQGCPIRPRPPGDARSRGLER